jgi:hypothetical protein
VLSEETRGASCCGGSGWRGSLTSIDLHLSINQSINQPTNQPTNHQPTNDRRVRPNFAACGGGGEGQGWPCDSARRALHAVCQRTFNEKERNTSKAPSASLQDCWHCALYSPFLFWDDYTPERPTTILLCGFLSSAVAGASFRETRRASERRASEEASLRGRSSAVVGVEG